ncbi:MAG: glycosyltransferase [Planctomycetota bacterium]
MKIGVVAIGRNEGERLQRCLKSVVAQDRTVVYVDSGSMDASVAFAHGLGVCVVELDTSVGFTAARARNAGWRRLIELCPDCEAVLFVDGDCEVREGFLIEAAKYLAEHPQCAVVSGRRRERYPEKTLFNRLVDLEWNTLIGEALVCHGDALIRIAALDRVGGFDNTMIAGEEPEMSVRLRQAGWTLQRIDREMTWHDADMHRLGQWWKRQVRAGHAYAEGFAKHGRSPQQHNARQVRSILFCGIVLPLFGVLGLVGGQVLALLLLLPGLGVLVYLYLFLKIARYRVSVHGDRMRYALLYACFVLLGKFANARGCLLYYFNRRRRRGSVLIEYKGAGDVA